MAEESIDFQNFNKKIIINPVVPLQMIDIYCRNKARVQATILGKVYSSSIEILEIVPDGLV
jgi:translation initiation factor IF-1